MTAHILIPALDEERPATLSPRIVDGMLKQKLGFRGLVLTDDMRDEGDQRRATARSRRPCWRLPPAATPC